jgi:hypothetical protein
MLIFAVLNLASAPSAQAQSTATATPSVNQPNWNIDNLDCSTIRCNMRVSPQGILYVFQDYPIRKLYVAPPDGTMPTEYDLSQAGQLIMGQIDFVPFDASQIVIFFTDAGQPSLTRYDLSTQQITSFSLSFTDRIVSCNNSDWFLTTLPYAISRLG